MTLRDAMWLAVRDFYAHSWRLLAVNAALGITLVASVLAALAFPPAAVLVVVVGPIAAALVHCAVTLVRTGNLELTDAWSGLRMHWRRGLALASLGAALAAAGVFGIRFYAATSLWPLAFLTLYVLVLLAIFQLVLWTVAIAVPERSLSAVARESTALALARPGQTLVLGLALLLVNAAGMAAAVMPFLTLTIAYTFLVTARFLVAPEEEAV